MGIHTRITLGIAGLAIFILTALMGSCKEDEETQQQGLPSDVRAAVEMLLDSIVVDSTTEIFVSGPVPAGSEFLEFQPDTTRPRAAIPLFEGGYAIFVNDNSGHFFSHPLRFAGVQPQNGDVLVVDAKWYPQLRVAGAPPEPFVESARGEVRGVPVIFGTGGGGAGTVDLSGKPADGPIPPAPQHVAAECKKVAWLLDGGEADDFWSISTASSMADNAGIVAGFLEGNGFEVSRTSQYSGNSLPGFYSSSGSISAKIESRLQSIAAGMTCQCEGNPPCHEFFLYICAHGSENPNAGFSVYDPGGEDVDYIRYSDLNTWLSFFQPCVKIIVFLDICYGGAAEAILSLQCAGRDCGVTLIMSCGESDSTPSGWGTTDSGTEDWGDGSGEDNDGDGVEGDLGDRWREMEDQNSDYNPRRFMCPGQTEMCSTD